MSERKNYHIFSGKKFIESMRSGGYKDTSYAIAELVDNSIDAKAKHIEILCQDKFNSVTGKYALEKIGILDDGHGMNSEELRSSLLFGEGNRGKNQQEIGKFGMGLPNSSLSQCKKVEVYSWQNNSESFYSYIDVDTVKQGNTEIPKPESRNIPNEWKEVADCFSKKSGTLVIWSKLDRCSWTTSKKIMEHSQFLIGRIYRIFLDKKTILINMKSLKVDDDGKVLEPKSSSMLPNDPMYLMAPSDTPGEWGKKPMFKPDVTPKKEFTIDYDNQQHIIVVRYSIERDELRDPTLVEGDQGSKKHGRHAGKNVGVSIIRANREITLDTNVTSTSDPRDRWWGVEIDIPTTLDNLVSITNNKQQVTLLSSMMYSVNRFSDDDSDEEELLDDLAKQDKARSQLLKMVREIYSDIRSMQRRIRATRKNTRKSSKSPPSSVDAKIDHGYVKGQQDGKHSTTDKERETMKKDERISVITDTLIEDDYTENDAKKYATEWVNDDRKIVFDTGDLEGHNFFRIKNAGGVLRIRINSQHRIYKNLLSLTDSDEHTDLSLKDRFELTKDGLWLLLASWARFEDLIENSERRANVQNTRQRWGEELNDFLEQNQT